MSRVELSGLSLPRLVVIGVGNPYRGDDAVGPRVIQALQDAGVSTAHVQLHIVSGACTSLLDIWQDADGVMIIDATSSGCDPGTIHCLDALQQSLPIAPANTSSHAFGVAEAIALGRALQQLPRRLMFYGIEGASFEVGQACSAAVSQAIPRLVARLQHDIAALCCQKGGLHHA